MLPIFPVYVTALIHIGHLLVACLMVAQVAFNSLGPCLSVPDDHC